MFSKETIEVIERDFAEAKPKLMGREDALFSVFDEANEEETICLKYLYSYLPLSDASAYDGELFLKLSRDALAAREIFPWGEGLTDELFLNYVLSVRVNNEDLTDHREIFREELAPRLRSKTMEEAALEVNLWSYEKATYQATDGRTVSPLTIIKRSFGRCGEESTFVVAALRAVGLPARQIYTPRWAHSDDNHAWVEVWTGEDWHYLGACEPEAVLDKGWFSAPAKRGMLMEARVFSGIINEPELIKKDEYRNHINVSDRYFDTAELTVKVSRDGKPVEGAKVTFNVVNYGSISTICLLETDADGLVSLKSGKGDLLVRVTHDDEFIEEKISLVNGDSTAELDFNERVVDLDTEFELVMHAPAESLAPEPEPTEEQEFWMNWGKKRAERLRQNFMDSFYEQPDEDAEDKDSLNWREQKVLANSLGNWSEIKDFLDEEESGLDREYKINLLESLAWKDLSDITAELLLHHGQAAHEFKDEYPEEVFKKSLLSPRFGREFITAWRTVKDAFTADEIASIKENPDNAWTLAHDKVKSATMPDFGGSVSPTGLIELGIGPDHSRVHLTLALLRAVGIPARTNPFDRQPEFYFNDEWNRFAAKSEDEKALAKAGKKNSKLTLKKDNPEDEIDLMTQLGLSSINSKGEIRGLNIYREEFNEAGEMHIDVAAGHYQVLLAKRRNSGHNVVRIIRFEVEDSVDKTVEISLPDASEAESVSFDLLEPELTQDYEIYCKDNISLFAILDLGAEPTEHFLNEILDNKEDFKELASDSSFLVKDEASAQNQKLQDVLRAFPEIDILYPAEGFDLEKYVEDSYEAYDLVNHRLPIRLVLDQEGVVKFAISGYQVGSVRQILNFVENMKES